MVCDESVNSRESRVSLAPGLPMLSGVQAVLPASSGSNIAFARPPVIVQLTVSCWLDWFGASAQLVASGGGLPPPPPPPPPLPVGPQADSEPSSRIELETSERMRLIWPTSSRGQVTRPAFFRFRKAALPVRPVANNRVGVNSAPPQVVAAELVDPGHPHQLHVADDLGFEQPERAL